MKIIQLFLVCLCINTYAQNFTRQDSLRGTITPERAWWDLLHYNLEVEVFPNTKSIQGVNTVTFKALKKGEIIQLDLQKPMKIDKVVQGDQELEVVSEGSAHFIQLPKKQKKNSEGSIVVYFSGKPRIAKNPPWDGGFSWKKDSAGKPFIATSNQGIGSSVWWPNKDHPYDEPNQGIDLKITCPKDLVAVGNGRLVSSIPYSVENDTTHTWHWKVINPINNYGVNVNVGNYASFSEKFEGLKGTLDMEYWVLKQNLEKAKEQFQQAPMMIEAFEYWFGPYPFYEDSFKLVEVPYLGMEHQSSVTYGNLYGNGYLGRDLSGTGWGLKFDFIIIHEGGHEWFANNITNKDVADMWIHEGFTAYSESLYLNYHISKEAASEYVIGTRRMIQNDRPIIGSYGVNKRGSSDMYYKGANTLHTLRQLVNDDDKWRDMLNKLNKIYYHQTVSSKEVEEFFSSEMKTDLSTFWEQYLRTTQVPKLLYKIENGTFTYKYTNVVEGFNMPLQIIIDEDQKWIYPTSEWQSEKITESTKTISVKADFYVESEVQI